MKSARANAERFWLSRGRLIQSSPKKTALSVTVSMRTPLRVSVRPAPGFPGWGRPGAEPAGTLGCSSYKKNQLYFLSQLL